MATSYPYGYAGATVTEAQLATKTTWQRLHPEIRRRFLALMREAAANGVSLGVGTGWRKQPTNPDGTTKPGFAAPGNSYHEGFMPGGTSRPDGVNDRNAMAIDTVLTSAWPWMNANCGRYGFIHFANVNSEPWHCQAAEIPRSRNFATHEPPLRVWPLPDGIGTPEEVFVTPEDKAYLQAQFNAVVAAMDDAWGKPPAGASSSRDTFLKQINANADLAVKGMVRLEQALNELDVDAVTAAITAAVTAALEDVTVAANVSDADIAKIAAASAAATVAEIAS